VLVATEQVEVVVMVAASRLAAAAATATAATMTEMVEGTGGARTGNQERRSGHNGQNQHLAKHQRSPHLVEHLRRVHSEKLHTPW
jgi:hypothetical protein